MIETINHGIIYPCHDSSVSARFHAERLHVYLTVDG